MVKADIGLIGLGVMGENLVLNIESRGFSVAVYNRTVEKMRSFVSGRGAGKQIIGCASPEELISSLAVPRKIILLVQAGSAVDDVLTGLYPLLDTGDIIIDGGNSHYDDTRRRVAQAEARGLRYVGMGVSGGEEGALRGPALMPGGTCSAWDEIRTILQEISARANDGTPCCDWLGSGGIGHLVKMVHNGIEYGEMQLMCELYQLLHTGAGLDNDTLSSVFALWNEGGNRSYLTEITADILKHREPDGTATLDVILDRAGQKGTGKWTAIAAFDNTVPLTVVAEAVQARCLSANREKRITAESLYGCQIKPSDVDVKQLTDDAEKALLAARIISFAQNIALMEAAAKQRGWECCPDKTVLLWRGGCIIRSSLLDTIAEAYLAEPGLDDLLLSTVIRDRLLPLVPALRRIVSSAVLCGIPVPCFSSALSYFDGFTCRQLPANLLQAQRDYFGAHKYERTDTPAGTMFHTEWQS